MLVFFLASLVLLHYSPVIEDIPHRETIAKIFPKDFCSSVNWRSSSQTFPRFVELLQVEDFTSDILEGFCISGGSMSEGVMRDANGAVANYLLASGAMGTTETERIAQVLVKILSDNSKVDRITIPLMKFLTKQLQRSLFADLQDEKLFEIINAVKKEILRSGRIDKIITVVELLCEFLQTSPDVARGYVIFSHIFSKL